MHNTNRHPGYLDHLGRFVLADYDQQPPFSSFLPGISGLEGIPMWVFYTNRGQAISSFGTESKDRPIAEFQSANTAYRQTEIMGFRTFILTNECLLEPFTSLGRSDLKREMFIGMNELEIREVDLTHQLEIRVLYFNLTDQPWPGLVRQVRVQNLSKESVQLNLLDGHPAIIPYGANNNQLKNISRTIESWMEVFNTESNLPFFRLRSSAEDISSVRAIKTGNYALAVSNGRLLPVIVDPGLVFGTDTSLRQPQGLLSHDLKVLFSMDQIKEGQTPCAFFGDSFTLAPGDTRQINSIYGSVKEQTQLIDLKLFLQKPENLEVGLGESRNLAAKLTDPIKTTSSNKIFDAYCRQTFLDNLLRGGSPIQLAGRKIQYAFSRRHGDPERDYNFFYLAAEKYSQGNGSYRDINQNRRSDVFFYPFTEDFNIRLFMSLIQIDGYNPLEIEGIKFSLPEPLQEKILTLVNQPEELRPWLKDCFSPGQLLDLVDGHGLKITPTDFIEQVFGSAKQHIQAQFEAGYWVDHWTYNLDMIDSYLNLYPDQVVALFFESDPYPFYDSPALVNPRSTKYVLDEGMPKQLNAIILPDDKQSLLSSRAEDPNWVRTDYGLGEIFRLDLFSKLTLLAVIKFATRDPFGMGIEMEAGKPGWCDALNGLPGMFGSSLPESFELLKLLRLLIEILEVHSRHVNLPVEASDLLSEILSALNTDQTLFEYWDAITTSRENYRVRTRMGVNGAIREYSAEEILAALRTFENEVQEGLDRALQYGGDIAPTYFSFQPTEYQVSEYTDPDQRPLIKPNGFEVNQHPLYLEGPVHQLMVEADPAKKHKLYQSVKDSQLYDPVLQTYVLNASLREESYNIGRARAFSPGWLENESVWLHMTFKYLLEVIRSGLYGQFFEDIQHCLPAFLDPDTYGRSPLENSSFIVSSRHPDPARHGRGFVARLTGATAEFISIWFTIMTGGKIFSLDRDGKLKFSLQPKLPGWLFPETGILSYHLLGKTIVQIHNPDRKDTWSLTPTRYLLTNSEGELEIQGDSLAENHALSIRSGQINQIDLFYDQ